MQKNQESSSLASENTSMIDYEEHLFKVPTKKIDDNASLEAFKKSEACHELLSFITAL